MLLWVISFCLPCLLYVCVCRWTWSQRARSTSLLRSLGPSLMVRMLHCIVTALVSSLGRNISDQLYFLSLFQFVLTPSWITAKTISTYSGLSPPEYSEHLLLSLNQFWYVSVHLCNKSRQHSVHTWVCACVCVSVFLHGQGGVRLSRSVWFITCDCSLQTSLWQSCTATVVWSAFKRIHWCPTGLSW